MSSSSPSLPSSSDPASSLPSSSDPATSPTLLSTAASLTEASAPGRTNIVNPEVEPPEGDLSINSDIKDTCPGCPDCEKHQHDGKTCHACNYDDVMNQFNEEVTRIYYKHHPSDLSDTTSERFESLSDAASDTNEKDIVGTVQGFSNGEDCESSFSDWQDRFLYQPIVKVTKKKVNDETVEEIREEIGDRETAEFY